MAEPGPHHAQTPHRVRVVPGGLTAATTRAPTLAGIARRPALRPARVDAVEELGR